MMGKVYTVDFYVQMFLLNFMISNIYHIILFTHRQREREMATQSHARLT